MFIKVHQSHHKIHHIESKQFVGYFGNSVLIRSVYYHGETAECEKKMGGSRWLPFKQNETENINGLCLSSAPHCHGSGPRYLSPGKTLAQVN